VTYDFNGNRKNASNFTENTNKEFISKLDFQDHRDYELVEKGFIATWDEDTIRNEDGEVVWDFKRLDLFNSHEDVDAPPEVNPSLWRQGKLLNKHGLFKVTDGIYQVRNFDLANMTAIRGETGWIIIDPLTCTETAAAALSMIKEHVEDLPVTGVYITHSHLDHFGGIHGVIDNPEDVRSRKIPLIAPYQFTYHTAAENVFAGPIKDRRLIYHSGTPLIYDEKGTVGMGLGPSMATGEAGLIEPNHELEGLEKEELVIDGVKFIFSEAMETEAVSESLFYVPKYKALCGAEVITKTQHNLLTTRGAQVRSSLKWAKVINRVIDMFGQDVEFFFTTHHWPEFGNKNIVAFLEQQRDLYLYLHNESLRLINSGVPIHELPHKFKFTEELEQAWHTRGYYGHQWHNTKAVYQYYIGWFDGNPATLREVPAKVEGGNLVKLAGGLDNLINNAVESFENGEYLWTTQLLGKVIFAHPDNEKVRFLLADALEQQGYQEESGSRRNIYLQGAKELRQGSVDANVFGFEVLELTAGITPEQLLDYLGVAFDSKKAADLKELKINMNFTDNQEKYHLEVTPNRVLTNHTGFNKEATVTLEGSKLVVLGALSGLESMEKLESSGELKVIGDKNTINRLQSALIIFKPDMSIVAP